jgi:hypothetical protein
MSDVTRRTLFRYDGFGRRVERLEYVNGTLAAMTRFIYDGWRVVEELDANYAVIRSYTLGLDLSGTFEGAGGIGGLLAMAQPAGSTFTAASYYHDRNGNVTALASDTGAQLARYRYSPFGERLEATGPLADDNPSLCDGFIYFGLAVFATMFAVLVAFVAEPEDKPQMLRVCITGALVNYAIFFVMSWAKKKGERWMKNRDVRAKS